jgi:hypothetical protein
MGAIKGFTLDASLRKIARNVLDMEKAGVVVDVPKTVENWNQKHLLVKPSQVEALQNDVALFIEVEKKRKLTSMSALGYGSFIAEPYVKKAKQLMSLNTDHPVPQPL